MIENLSGVSRGTFLDHFIQISTSLLTPLIAVITAYIAWQQAVTSRQKLNLDRYDRRLRIYEEVRKILSIIMRDGKANTDELLRFRVSVSEADFLFGPEIPQYIDEIYTHGLRLSVCKEEYRDYTQDQPEGYDHEKVVAEMHAEFAWLTDQFEPAKQKFKKYLDISK